MGKRRKPQDILMIILSSKRILYREAGLIPLPPSPISFHRSFDLDNFLLVLLLGILLIQYAIRSMIKRDAQETIMAIVNQITVLKIIAIPTPITEHAIHKITSTHNLITNL